MWFDTLEILKIPLMGKREYDQLIRKQFISRIAFQGKHPYIAPFLYIFDGKFLYFLSTKYGKKIELFRSNPNVAVEIEDFKENLEEYNFVTLQGRIQQVTDVDEKIYVKERFVKMIREKKLSLKVLAALGHSPDDPLQSILDEEKSYVWKLVDVNSITGIKNS